VSTVIFLCGQTMGDALGSTGRSFKRLFESLGHDFATVDFAQPDAGPALDRVMSKGDIEFVFTFVGMGADIRMAGSDGTQRNLWNTMRIPFISLNGDSPAYFFDRHVLSGPMFASLYAFPEHYRLRKRLPANRCMFGVVPHVLLDATPKQDIDFSRKEQGKLLFLKNGNDPEELLVAWREALPDSVFLMLADLAGELAGQIQSELGNDIDTLVVDYFQNKGIDIHARWNLRLFFIAQLDDYLRRLKSTLIAKSLLDLPIEVHGFNWGHVDFGKRRAKLVNFADHNASRGLIKESLGLLDMSPNTGLAPHDRPMRAYGMHTLCLTNEQEYFRRTVPQFCDAFTFRFDPESVQSKVADVLAHPRRYLDLGIEVAAAFRSGHEPEIFGQFMLDLAKCLKLEGAPRFPNLQPYFGWPPTSLE
jgi:hypothetical protein